MDGMKERFAKNLCVSGLMALFVTKKLISRCNASSLSRCVFDINSPRTNLNKFGHGDVQILLIDTKYA